MLYFVYLRRPQKIEDPRSDPFWEFGSFGKTGCHKSNLLHPIRTPLLDGDRLVFLQGGDQVIRVVGLTPPITVRRNAGKLDLRWDVAYRPIPYDVAPMLIDNMGDSNFPAVRRLLANTQRSTYCGQAASRLRSRTSPVDIALTSQLLKYFDQTNLQRIKHYLEAVDRCDSTWFRHGVQKDWCNLDGRKRDFDNLTKATHAPSICTTIQSSLARRSRC